MKKSILLRGARQLLTLHGPEDPRRGASMRELGLIQDGAVLIVDGVIHDVGPSRRVENLAAARDAVEISADGRVVMPGFVDCHAHLVSGPPLLADYEMRIAGAGPEEIAAAGGGSPSSARAARTSSKRRLELEARKTLRQFIRHGTTTIDAISGSGLDERTELKILRVVEALDGSPLELGRTFLGAHTVPRDYEGTPEAYLDEICSTVLPKIRKRRLARSAAVRCGEGAFTPSQARRYLLAARELGFIPRIITSESAHDGGVAVGVELGVASADHLEHISKNDIELLARSQTIAALLPGAVFHQGLDRYPPARRLIDQGAAVALATDFSPTHCPSCSMPAMLSLACAQMGMSPAEAVTAATINAAHAMRSAGRIGSLEYGKDADLIMLEVSDYREIPYHFGMNLLTMIMKRGEVLYPRMEFPWSRS